MLSLLPEWLSLPPTIGCYSLRGRQLRMVRFRRRGSCLKLSSRCCPSHPPRSSSLFRLPACFPTDITESVCHQPLRAIADYPIVPEAGCTCLTLPGGAQAQEMLFLVASLHTPGNRKHGSRARRLSCWLAREPCERYRGLHVRLHLLFSLCFALLQQ